MAQDFTERLRLARERRKLSQTDLAEHTGLQASAISHFETGKRAPSFENLKKLADSLNVSIDFLVGRSESLEAATPQAEQIYRDLAKMSASDQETLAEMAALLAKRNQQKGDQAGG